MITIQWQSWLWEGFAVGPGLSIKEPNMKHFKLYFLVLLAASVAAVAVGCAAKAAQPADLMSEVSPSSVTGKPADQAFIESMAQFSIGLFQKSITDKENSLISPLSVMLALSMTANGADNATLAQMETLLGGGIPISELNEYLHSYAAGLPNAARSRLDIANSIWFRGDEGRLSVEPDFLRRNADYYGADAYRAAFDDQTVKDINNWVKEKTEGMIDSIIEEIEDEMMLILLNAVMFDAQWQEVYYEAAVRVGIFTDIWGTEKDADFMYSLERRYIDDGQATGFIKPYAGRGYSFAALLPNEGVDIGDYIESLDGSGFLEMLNGSQETLVNASMPKFEYSYEIKMNDILIALGIPDAFDEDVADFTKMGKTQFNLYISLVLHKTFISVDELGTKAGAVTMVAKADGAGPQEIKTVRLDRPFVYAIIDNATNLPVFIGTLMTV